MEEGTSRPPPREAQVNKGAGPSGVRAPGQCPADDRTIATQWGQFPVPEVRNAKNRAQFRRAMVEMKRGDPRTNGLLMDTSWETEEDWKKKDQVQRPVATVHSRQYGPPIPRDPREEAQREHFIAWKTLYNADRLRHRRFPGTNFFSAHWSHEIRDWKPAYTKAEELKVNPVKYYIEYMMPVMNLPQPIRVKVFQRARGMAVHLPEIRPDLVNVYTQLAEDWLMAGVDWDEATG